MECQAEIILYFGVMVINSCYFCTTKSFIKNSVNTYSETIFDTAIRVQNTESKGLRYRVFGQFKK